MDDSKIRQFIALAGQKPAEAFVTGTPAQRELGAQLLLSETLEYVIKGLGVVPTWNGAPITDANALTYKAAEDPEKEEMLDGLADVAYTMFWNSVTFGIPLEKGFSLVCQNNLEKFVAVEKAFAPLGELDVTQWHCDRRVNWPTEVDKVFIIEYEGQLFAVGKDRTGKVRKPSTYQSVDLSLLVA